MVDTALHLQKFKVQSGDQTGNKNISFICVVRDGDAWGNQSVAIRMETDIFSGMIIRTTAWK